MDKITQLVDGETLLKELFDERSRPTIRWLREQQKNKAIPFLKIGHLVRFHVPTVQAALERRTIKAREKACK